ncbi:MAG: hypothetical protein RL143_801 [Pseudomonadota bacterium]
MNQRLKTLATLAILIVSIAALSFWSLQNANTDTTASCEIDSGKCEFTLDQQDYQISFGPMPAKALQPMRLELATSNRNITKVWVDLQGVDMYMGVNQFELTDIGNSWQGTTELAVCTTGKMRWLARVIIEQNPSETLFLDLTFDAE